MRPRLSGVNVTLTPLEWEMPLVVIVRVLALAIGQALQAFLFIDDVNIAFGAGELEARGVEELGGRKINQVDEAERAADARDVDPVVAVNFQCAVCSWQVRECHPCRGDRRRLLRRIQRCLELEGLIAGHCNHDAVRLEGIQRIQRVVEGGKPVGGEVTGLLQT